MSPAELGFWYVVVTAVLGPAHVDISLQKRYVSQDDCTISIARNIIPGIVAQKGVKVTFACKEGLRT